MIYRYVSSLQPGAYLRLFGFLLTVLFGLSMGHAESLFREETYKPLTSDNKAFRVGDVLTVQIFENSTAVTSADTGTNRKNAISAGLSHNGAVGAQSTIGVDSSFAGGGKTQRTNRVLTTLTVTVREVLANGELKVSGEQMLTVNEEPQRVTLEGRVRSLDISEGNIVLSTRLADAKITYAGQGDLAEQNRRPWWRRLLDWAGV